MKVEGIALAKNITAAYVEDIKKIKRNAQQVNPLQAQTKAPGTAVSIVMRIDGIHYRGDAVSVQYANAFGRSKPIDSHVDIVSMAQIINQKLPTMLPPTYKEACATVEEALKGYIYSTPVMYGVSQCLLKAYAGRSRQGISDFICHEYGLERSAGLPKILVQTNRHDLDTITSAVELEPDILPHANFCTTALMGEGGGAFRRYFRDVVQIVSRYCADRAYCPTLHFDLYGTLGELFEFDISKVVDYIVDLSAISEGLPVQIESPVIMGSQRLHFDCMHKIRSLVRKRTTNVQIVLDEWANTLADIRLAVDMDVADLVQIKMPDLGSITNSIEAVLYCHSASSGMKAYLGGTSNETVESALLTTEVAYALSPHQVLAKPGMDINCGYSLVKNCLSSLRLISEQ